MAHSLFVQGDPRRLSIVAIGDARDEVMLNPQPLPPKVFKHKQIKSKH